MFGFFSKKEEEKKPKSFIFKTIRTDDGPALEIYCNDDNSRDFYKLEDYKDFYQEQREWLNETSSYHLFPSMARITSCDEGMYGIGNRLNQIQYLKSKARLSALNNWESDFGGRITATVKITDWGQDAILRKTKMEVTICPEGTNINIFQNPLKVTMFITCEDYEAFNYSEETWGILFTNALNGNLQTMKDREKYLKSRSRDINLEDGWEIFKCHECGERFTNLQDFCCHLANEGHYDKIVDEYPYDRQAVQLKRIIKETRAEKLAKAQKEDS